MVLKSEVARKGKGKERKGIKTKEEIAAILLGFCGSPDRYDFFSVLLSHKFLV